MWYRLLRPLSAVRDVTGAGDALLAGAASAFVAGWPLEDGGGGGMAKSAQRLPGRAVEQVNIVNICNGCLVLHVDMLLRKYIHIHRLYE